ncbi:MAG: TIGR02099 family protein [Gammaproteobacteria bacterium]|nr:TIGR02099 family protein [Gammaproteobacteria bacterium]MBU1601321.1 TIGR02099 family protein [Gammaproteobacteria bacterium]MBU2433902.1 TIGR02099 family protein [Gammaproteobacteria bacterium]MBU2450580.1 TIGR02099 family protein [Gammaproteobacteria bacterium]
MSKLHLPNPPAIPTDVRIALYHRLHWLWPVLASRGIRLLGWGVFAAWLAFVVLILTLRYAVLPKIGDYQSEIERAVTQAVGLPVKIGHIEARWRGLNPDLVLDEVMVADRQGAPAFTLARIEGVLSWHTLWRLRPTLALLAFDRPVLHIRRETNGKITVAGVDTEGESDPAFGEWVLQQRRIRIRDATIVWDDRLRKAPPLVLEDLQLALDNSGRRHRFGLSAAPPDELAARVDIRGEVKGDLGEALENLSGRLFVELDYADLAGWRAWLDYPVHLPRGRGALRVWGDLGDGTGKLTADVALEDVRMRLGRQLPELELASMRGRIAGQYKADAWMVAGHQVELQTQDGIRIAPSDFKVEWQRDAATATVNGNSSASFLDLAVLGRLAAYLPLDAQSRGLLLRHRPQGRIAELRASWTLEGEKLSRYSLRAGFRDMGIEADRYFPGAGGVSGSIDLTEKGGDLRLDSGVSSLSLPAIFPEPDIALDALKVKASWKNSPHGTDIQLDKLEFAGPDAAGSAQGTYRYTGDGPGEIDLTASIERGEGRAVWRYMPHAVNASARNWIRRGIVGGRGYDGKLILKGNLKDFPFRDGKGGRFIVTAKATGAKVDYADGWPVIDDIDADMSFDTGMRIKASKGRILGATLADVKVDIPDFEAHEEMLLVRGTARGPTGEFLRFIEESPVTEKIDRFTEGMKAAGNGSLKLELDIPLRHALDTRMRGDYRFLNNQLQPLAGLPPLTQVNGRLLLTENTVASQDIAGQVFGGPLKVQVRSAAEKVAVVATGTAAIGEVSRHFGWPLINHLSGNAAWKADIGIRRRNADVVVESDLLGISSPLPDPLNKNAMTALPLRIERTAPDAEREQYRITLGKVAQGLVVRRLGNWERGVLAVGEGELRLPEKGLAVRVVTPRIDADAWRNFLPEGAAGGDGSGLALNVVTLKAPQLHLFDRDYNQVEVSLRPQDSGWQIGLNTREAVGNVFWKSAGEGWVEGNFKRLVVRPAAEAAEGTSSLINTLPGMSLTVDNFFVGDKALGRLELKARNDKGAWHLDNLSLENPDGGLKGKAVWNNTGANHTRLDFELNAKDMGKLLDRLGYADSVRRGKAKMTGDLKWNGPLTDIHYPSLTGQLNVDAEKGQFNKLEPGVGKLLGLISLQSLPRRLTLDFRDIFSDGLAFDSIEGKLSIRQGVMRTVDPLRIYGPSAQIEMQGETDLKAETQDMQVVVRPELGGLAAVGAAALVNPVVGAAALVANTVLQKPLNRLFSYRYHVTGTWADPQVNKTGESAPEVKLPPGVDSQPVESKP